MPTVSWVVLVIVVGVLGFCIGRWHATKYYVRLLTLNDIVKLRELRQRLEGRRW